MLKLHIKIDTKKRHQVDLNMADMYPQLQNACACGCTKPLTGRRTKWASDTCRSESYYLFAIIKGNTGIIRHAVFERDLGVCNSCGTIDEKWEADHIIPVHQGGGGCSLDNFQTLCTKCHKAKTKRQLIMAD